jgi:hypothetical protein
MLERLAGFVRSLTAARADGIWCVTCRAPKTVRVQGYVEQRTRKAATRRLIGCCEECGKATSTFVSPGS